MSTEHPTPPPSPAVERAVENGSPTDVLIAAVEEAYSRASIPLTDDEVRYQGLMFGAALADLARRCEVNLFTLQAACALVVSATQESCAATSEQIEESFESMRITVQSLRTYRQLHGGARDDASAAVH